MPKKELRYNTQTFLVILGVILIILAGIFYLKNKSAKQPSIVPNPEETLFQQEGMVRKTGELVRPLTDEEIQKMREETDGVLSVAGQEAVLKDKTGLGITGVAKRAFSDSKFYFKIDAKGLKWLDKGYYYEGFLEKDNQYISLGRVEVDNFNNGLLYYSGSQDKSDYQIVVVTKEVEDNNPAPGEIILQGQF